MARNESRLERKFAIAPFHSLSVLLCFSTSENVFSARAIDAATSSKLVCRKTWPSLAGEFVESFVAADPDELPDDDTELDPGQQKVVIAWLVLKTIRQKQTATICSIKHISSVCTHQSHNSKTRTLESKCQEPRVCADTRGSLD